MQLFIGFTSKHRPNELRKKRKQFSPNSPWALKDGSAVVHPNCIPDQVERCKDMFNHSKLEKGQRRTETASMISPRYTRHKLAHDTQTDSSNAESSAAGRKVRVLPSEPS